MGVICAEVLEQNESISSLLHVWGKTELLVVSKLLEYVEATAPVRPDES